MEKKMENEMETREYLGNISFFCQAPVILQKPQYHRQASGPVRRSSAGNSLMASSGAREGFFGVSRGL